MTDTPNLDWDHWQLAWRNDPPVVATAAARTAELQRRLRRHRRLAWAYTLLDVFAALLLFATATYFLIRAPILPVLVWSLSVFAFTAIALAGTIWNRRDALVASADSTSDFLAALRLRQGRRERVPRFLLRLAAAEIAFGLAFHAIWWPEWLGRAARIYGAIALALAAWWRWYRRRLARERAQLDALCSEPEPEDAPEPA
jgi:membrane associated rhomboid family serine protease